MSHKTGTTRPLSRNLMQAPDGPRADTCTYASDIAQFRPFEREEEHAVAMRAATGDETARELLINHSLHLAVSEARRYHRQSKGALPLADLIAIASEGLIHAVDLFDSSLNVPLKKYAFYWIRQRVLVAFANQAHAVTIPAHARGDVRTMESAARCYTQEHWTPATDEILAGKTGIPLEKVRSYRALMSADTLQSASTAQNLPHARRYWATEDALTRRVDPDVDDRIDARDLQDLLRRAVDELPADLAIVVRLTHGLDNHKERSFVEIGRGHAIGRETARCRYQRAITMLTHGPHAHRLRQLFAPSTQPQTTTA